jgi:hypothetical protein
MSETQSPEPDETEPDATDVEYEGEPDPTDDPNVDHETGADPNYEPSEEPDPLYEPSGDPEHDGEG